LLKRFKLKSLLLYLKCNNKSDIHRLLEYYLNYIYIHGGCFHLWGHSWEIEKNNLWADLEIFFKTMANIRGIDYVNNRDLLTMQKEKL
jgi:peptidoglycan-N-acetylglucosamine deacetylase